MSDSPSSPVFVRKTFSAEKRKNRNSRSALSRYRERRAQGLCPYCGLREPQIPFVYCGPCREKNKRFGERKTDEKRPDHALAKAWKRYQREQEGIKAKPLEQRVPGRTRVTPKTGDMWSEAEEQRLIELLDNVVPMEEICRELKRSEVAVIKRGRKLGRPECDPNDYTTPYAFERMKKW